MNKLGKRSSEKQEQNKQLFMRLNTFWLIKRQNSYLVPLARCALFMLESCQGLRLVKRIFQVSICSKYYFYSVLHKIEKLQSSTSLCFNRILNPSEKLFIFLLCGGFLFFFVLIVEVAAHSAEASQKCFAMQITSLWQNVKLFLVVSWHHEPNGF